MSIAPSQVGAALKPTDFASDQEVKWCPGCGDYSVLAQTKRILSKLGYDKSNTVFVSGIGCSSRFPYYMATYGFHSIHGRAPTVATGLKLARPDLNVFIVTGDGDALSIGGNHFIHLMRRNIDLKIILFNNRIYGLTKGQYSPTSEHGKKTKSSPMGTVEPPIRPISVALGAEASFAARALDADVKHLEYVLERACKHVGTAFVEVYQNCVIFNDGAYAYAADKGTRADSVVYLEHGKPLVFGKNLDKGIRLNGGGEHQGREDRRSAAPRRAGRRAGVFAEPLASPGVSRTGRHLPRRGRAEIFAAGARADCASRGDAGGGRSSEAPDRAGHVGGRLTRTSACL